MSEITRAEAMDIFMKYNKSESLTKHALAVEGVMRHFAEIFNEDMEKWGIVGLLHDVDYEMYPDAHCVKAVEILAENGLPDEYIRAVVSHGYGICSDTEPLHKMEKLLYAVDELAGLITAAALMRPSKSVMDLEYKSLLKKFKTPSFAAGVNREVVEKGCEMLNMELKYVVEETISAMRKIADSIGLAGRAN